VAERNFGFDYFSTLLFILLSGIVNMQITDVNYEWEAASECNKFYYISLHVLCSGDHFFFDQAKALQAYSDGQREGDNKDMQLSTLAKVRNKKRSSFYIATACNNLTERRIVVKFIFNER
jgi:hypothetical protein